MGSPARPLGSPLDPAPAPLADLLASGKVFHAAGRHAPPQREAFPRWELGRLFGRVVEVTGQGASARLTVAVQLVRQAQERGEVVAWIGAKNAMFFPPDLAEHGVDLDAVVVVRVDDANAMFQATDHLLRSGAFGLVVVDLEGRRYDVPMAVQVRLLNLTKAHDAALLLLFEETGGSLASLRAHAQRERRTVTSEGRRFHVTLRVQKDKHVGHPWEHEQAFRGPLGLG